MPKVKNEKEMPFLEHLEELRWVIVRSGVALVIGMIVCFIFADFILKLLTHPTTRLENPLALQVLKVQGMLTVYLEIGFFGGLVLTLPYLLYQVWTFISPGLLSSERRYLPMLLGFSTLLFLIGISFAYRIILPFAIDFLIGLAPKSIAPNIAIDFYIGFAIRLMLLFGIVFQLPVLSYFLSKIGLLTSGFMKKYRRHAVVAIFIMAAVLTPPDPITQVLLGVPLVLLYEFSIWIVWMVERKEKSRELLLDSDIDPRDRKTTDSGESAAEAAQETGKSLPANEPDKS